MSLPELDSLDVETMKVMAKFCAHRAGRYVTEVDTMVLRKHTAHNIKQIASLTGQEQEQKQQVFAIITSESSELEKMNMITDVCMRWSSCERETEIVLSWQARQARHKRKIGSIIASVALHSAPLSITEARRRHPQVMGCNDDSTSCKVQ